MRCGCRTQCPDDPLIELPGVWTVTDEVKKPARIEIVGQMQKIELLSDDAHHAGQRGSDGVRARHAPFVIELIGQAPADPMRLAFDAGNAMTHRKE